MTSISKTPSRSARSSSTVLMLILGLVATFVLGCGSSTDLNQISGQQGGPIGGPQTGSLTFDFVQAQATEVPVGTTNIKFEFFSEDDATGSKTVTPDVVRAFAAQIVIDNVPTTTRSVRVTAYNADGLPTRVFVANVNVVAGTNTVVGDLGDGTAVTANGLTVTPTNASINVGNSQQFTAAISFTNGEVISKTSATGLEWSTPPGSPATIAQTGLATGVAAGTAAITGSFGGQSDTVDLEVTAIDPGLTLVSVELEVDPETDIALGETVAFTVFGNFEDEEGAETRENITGNPDFTIALNVDDEDADPSVLTADENNPFLFTGTAEGTATVEAVVSGGGLEEPLESNEIDVTVGVPTFRVYGVPTEGGDADTLTLPIGGFQWGIILQRVHPNGTVLNTYITEAQLEADDLSLDYDGGTNVALAGTTLTTDGTFDAGQGGTVSVVLEEDGEDPAVVYEFEVDAADATITNVVAEALVDGDWVEFPNGPLPAALEVTEGDVFVYRLIATVGTGEDAFDLRVTTSPQVELGGTDIGDHLSISEDDPRNLVAGEPTLDGEDPDTIEDATIGFPDEDFTDGVQVHEFFLRVLAAEE